MIGIGTIVNSLAIILGGLVGLVSGNRLKERYQKILNVSMGLSVLVLAISGFVSKMVVINGSALETRGTYMLIFSLVFGALVGEFINLDEKMERFGEYLKNKTGNSKDNQFVDGFVTASLTVCIGAMAVVGALMDGMNGDPSILFTKAILDFVIILVLSASLGKGCLFSFIPVFLFQGSITLLAKLIAPIMSPLAIDNLSLVGNTLIMCIGINILADSKFRIKVANLLPAVLFAVIAAYISFLN